MASPVVMVHGWGGSFRRTWLEVGWVDLLADAGRTAIGVDLLGHGDNDKPHDSEAYLDLTAPVVTAMSGHEQVAAVGFSLGAMTVLTQASRTPERFERLVLCGIGESVLRPPEPNGIVDALEGRGAAEDIRSQVFLQYATQPGNDLVALTACMKAERARPSAEQLAAVTCPTLVIVGDKDEAGPGQPLADALPNARLVTLRNVDHFATTGDFGCIDAVLDFLA